jgi:hypothetical protein
MNGTSGGDAKFESRLEQGRQRFLAHAIENALAVGRRTPLDFIRHFSPHTIMEALAERKDLRAGLLVPTTGLKHKIAIKKSWQSSAEDLQTALDEGETDAQAIVTAFDPDDRVRYLDDKKLWSFLVEGQFWQAPPKGAEIATARVHVAFLIDRALTDKLITSRDVVDGVSVAQVTSHLPRGELAKIIQAALDSGRGGKPFTDVELLGALPSLVLVEHLPLGHVFESVLHAKVAIVHGYIEGPKPAVVTEKKASLRPSRPPGEGEDADWVEIPDSGRPPPDAS